MDRRPAALLLAAAGALLSSVLCAQTPLGSERTVQQLPFGLHGTARVAAAANGGRVAIWGAVETLRKGSGHVFLQLLSPDGTPQGEPFRPGTGLTDENGPDVAMAEDGSFVAVWEEVGNRLRRVLARRFDAQGRPQGAAFPVVSSQSVPFQLEPSVAVAVDGGFVIAWTGNTQPTATGSTADVYARRFDAAGRPLGAEFQVNVTKWGAQSQPRVAPRPSGFLIGWTSETGPRTRYDVYARPFAADGAPLGGEIRVNSGSTLPFLQSHLALAAADDGSFVAVWQDSQADRATPAPKDGQGLLGQLFTAAGKAAGPVFHVNLTGPGAQSNPAVAFGPAGFLVAWETVTEAPRTVKTSVQMRRFSRQGAPLTGEIAIDASTPASRNAPALALDPDGDGLVVWVRVDADGFGSDLLAREIQP